MFCSQIRVEAYLYIFFFQAEDGIRDLTVTGVQTCALPILLRNRRSRPCERPSAIRGRASRAAARKRKPTSNPAAPSSTHGRSEERRVGKECRSRRSADQ